MAACVVLFGHSPLACSGLECRYGSPDRTVQINSHIDWIYPERAIEDWVIDGVDLFRGTFQKSFKITFDRTAKVPINATEIREIAAESAKTTDFALAEEMMLLWGARVDELTKQGQGPAK